MVAFYSRKLLNKINNHWARAFLNCRDTKRVLLYLPSTSNKHLQISQEHYIQPTSQQTMSLAFLIFKEYLPKIYSVRHARNLLWHAIRNSSLRCIVGGDNWNILPNGNWGASDKNCERRLIYTQRNTNNILTMINSSFTSRKSILYQSNYRHA